MSPKLVVPPRAPSHGLSGCAVNRHMNSSGGSVPRLEVNSTCCLCLMWNTGMHSRSRTTNYSLLWETFRSRWENTAAQVPCKAKHRKSTSYMPKLQMLRASTSVLRWIDKRHIPFLSWHLDSVTDEISLDSSATCHLAIR